MKRHLFPLLLILVVGLFSTRALFHPGLFTAHDIWHQVARLYWYKAALSEGTQPLWITTLSNGFGYPLFIFSYSLPWLLGSIFIGFGLSIFDSIKTLFILSFLASGLFMYILGFTVFKSRVGAFTSAILYMLAPYHLLQMLVSAAMGRMFVFAFAPLLFLGVYLLQNKETQKRGTIIFAVSFLSLSLSHLMSLISLSVPLFFLVLWIKPPVKAFLKAVTLSLGLSLFYVGPAFIYSSLTQAKSGSFSYLYKSGFINLKQLIYSKWGYGMVVHDAREGAISYQLGFAQWFILFSLFIAFLLFITRKKDRNKKIFSLSMLVSAALSIFLMLIYSKPFWDFISPVITIDYPTMFLTSLVFVSSLSSSFIIALIKNRAIKVVFVCFLFLLIFINVRNYLRVNMYTNFPLQTYIDSETTTSSFGEYYPTGFDQKVTNTEKKLLVFEKADVSDVSYTPTSLIFHITNKTPQALTLRQLSFPGVTLFIDGKKTEYQTSKEKLISIYLEKGEYDILITYKRTPLMYAFLAISLISTLLLIFFALKK